jgi:hypothetical protein
MKLRNKKTGEVVVEVNKIGLVWNRFGMPADIGQYDSLAELNAEWEDYEPTEKKPRRYRLIKDLPTFDKGDEFYIAQTGALWYDGGGDDDVFAYGTQTLMEFPNILADWFEPIDGEDENVLSKEPLIKDEKIRKCVKLWLEINEIYSVTYHKRRGGGSYLELDNMPMRNGCCIVFQDLIEGLKDEQVYTVAELCGEEEE